MIRLLKSLTNLRAVVGILVIVVSLSFLTGCSGSTKKPAPKTYSYASSQLSAEPIYNRLRIVHLPYVQPARDLDPQIYTEKTTSGSAVISLSTSNKTLEQIARDLGKALDYSAYCSSVLAPRVASSGTTGETQIIGSADQVVAEISKREGIKVVVDHQSREIRFLSATPEAELPSPSIQ